MKRLLLVAILVIFSSIPTIAQEDNQEWKWETAFNSVVLISTETNTLQLENKEPNSPPSVHGEDQPPVTVPIYPPKFGVGTGFFINPIHVVTNYHVIKDVTTIQVYAYGHPYEILDVKVVGFDAESDIAVLEIKSNINHETLKFADKDAMIGDDVYALGHGSGQMWSLTKGIISYDTRPNQQSSWVHYLQTDAVINSGNSGGPLLNEDGDVVGVNTLIISPTNYYVGYGYAVPGALVERVVNHILAHGQHIKPSIGIMMGIIDDKELFYTLRDSGKEHYLEVKGLTEGGPAENFGILEGDIIVSINAKKVSVTNEVIRMLWDMMPGETISIEIYRDGTYKTYDVVLGTAEAPQVRIFGIDQ